MGELIPPGSVVEIDTAQNAVQVGDWKSLRERPIYLVWHTGAQLLLVSFRRQRPYGAPLSHLPAARQAFEVLREACVIGRVTKAWLPFHQESSDEGQALIPGKAPRSGLTVTEPQLTASRVSGE